MKGADDPKPGLPLLATVLICGTMQETASLCRVFSLDAEATEVLTAQGRRAGKMACVMQIN